MLTGKETKETIVFNEQDGNKKEYSNLDLDDLDDSDDFMGSIHIYDIYDLDDYMSSIHRSA